MDKDKLLRGINAFKNICIDNKQCKTCPLFNKNGHCNLSGLLKNSSINSLEEIKQFKMLITTTIIPLQSFCRFHNVCENCSFYIYDNDIDHEICMFDNTPNEWDINLIDYNFYDID